MNTKIILSRQVTSVKTTIGRLLVEKLNYDFVSLGTIIRARAQQEGIHVAEFQKRCKENVSINKEMDAEFGSFCNEKDQLVVDYKMGFRFVRNAFHVYLKISEEDALERLKAANRPDENFETVRERSESFKSQFLNAYQVDYTDECHYDLVINVSNKTGEEISQTIVNYFNLKQ